MDVNVPLADATVGPFEGTCLVAPELYLPVVGSVPSVTGGSVIPGAGVWYRFRLAETQIVAISLQGADGAALYRDHGTERALVEPRCLRPEDHLELTAGDYLLTIARPATDLPGVAEVASLRFERHAAAPLANASPGAASDIALPFETTVAGFSQGRRGDAACADLSVAWYRYQPPERQTVALEVRPSRTSYPVAAVTVFEVDDAGTRGLRLCGSAFGPIRRAFTARPTRSYLIGIGADQAVFEVRMSAHPFPDAKADAVPLLDAQPAWFSTRLANAESGEATGCGGARSVWFELPPATATARIELADMDGLDVSLAVVDAAGDTVRCANRASTTVAAHAAPQWLRIASPDAVGGSVQLHLQDRYGTRISSTSPWGDESCGPRGISVVGSEVEVSLAVSPADPDHLIAGWQQDRTTHGGARGLVTATSFDGGRTWTHAIPAGGSECTGGPFARATDPWVTIASDGTAFLTTLGYDGEVPSDGAPVYGASAMLVHRSTDGGLTWESPAMVAIAPGVLFHDKQTLLAHPGDPDRIYLTWSQVIGTEFSNVLARSIDGGRTWLPPEVLPTGAVSGVGDQLEILADGRLAHVLANRVPDTIQVMVSETDGRTWSAPIIVGRGTSAEGPGVRGGNFIPDVATDGRRLFVAWTTEAGTYLATSSEDLRTWSRTLAVPGDARFTSAVAARADGTVAITAYELTEPYSRIASVRLALSVDGGRSFTDRALTSSFDIGSAPYSSGRGLFLGDYAGLVATPSGFVSARPMTPFGGADVFIERIPA